MDLRRTYASPVGRLRLIGFVEGLSFVALMGIGMPMKYWMGNPIGVRVLGPIHGVLFLWLCMEIAQAVLGKGWPKGRGVVVFIAAWLPFGPFVIDSWLKKQQLEFDAGSSASP